MLSHFTSSTSERRSYRVTRDLLSKACTWASTERYEAHHQLVLVDDAPRSQGQPICSHLSPRFSDCQHPFGFCKYSDERQAKKRKSGSTDSCFKPSRLSFNLAPRASTSRRKAADCARIAAVSARVRVVISARISDSAARMRYACCAHKSKRAQDGGQRGTLRCRDPCT